MKVSRIVKMELFQITRIAKVLGGGTTATTTTKDKIKTAVRGIFNVSNTRAVVML